MTVVLRLDSEVELVWRKYLVLSGSGRKRPRLTLIDGLYFIMRYLGLLYCAQSFLWLMFDLKMSERGCYILYALSMAIQTIVIMALQVMMIIRLHAMYSRSVRILRLLLGTFIAQTVTSLSTSIVLYGPFGKPIMQSSIESHAVLCGNLLSSLAFWTGTLSQLVTLTYEAVLVSLTLFKYVVYVRERHQLWQTWRTTHLLAILVRDNLSYFFMVIAALLLEIVSFDVWDRKEEMNDPGLLYMCMSDVLVISVISICGPRMILNLRLQDKSTVLGDPEETIISSLRFSVRSTDDDISVP